MPVTDINYVAVLLAALTNMILGALWYSPLLFAKPWMKLIGKKMDDLKGGANAGYAVAMINSLLMAFVLAHFVDYTNATTALNGFLTGLWAWIGFTGSTGATNYIFAGKSWKLWLIDYGYFAVGLPVMGTILATLQ